MNGKRNRPAGGGSGGAAIRGTNFRPQYTTKAGADSIPIYVGERVVGTVEGDTFYKRIAASIHFLQKPRAIAFDVSTLRDAERAGARRVEVTDYESGRVFCASLATIWAKGRPLNRGYGAQWRLALDEWNRDDAPAQLSLFGVMR